MANPIFVLDISPDGIVATHPARLDLPVRVAPVPTELKTQNFNAIRAQLVTIACMKLPGGGFEFDSSFVSPNPRTVDRFTKFAELMKALQNQDDQKRFPPCSVFGHADPTGTDDYNKTLAGRRARAVYGLLVRDPKLWDELYNNQFGGDRWGIRSIRTMLSIPLQPGEAPFYSGPIDPTSQADKNDAQKQTHDAIAAYQESRSLLQKGSGFPGDKTRATLFKEYMDAICKDKDGNAFQLQADRDFLAKRKDGAGLKGDVQGCGDFNEIFLLTKDEDDAAKKNKALEAVRNELYRVDRRVVVYVFKHGSEIDPKKWPCPRSKEGPTDCALRFWSDYKDRRKRTDQQRTFGVDMDVYQRNDDHSLVLDGDGNPTPRPIEETGNTMACRWYHAFAIHSPCERKMEEWIVRFRVDLGMKDSKENYAFLSGRRYVVIAGETDSSAVIRGTTTDKGEIRIPVFDEQAKIKVKLDAFDPMFSTKAPVKTADDNQSSGDGTEPFKDEDTFMVLTLDGGALKAMAAAADEMPAKQRLYNLGYGPPTPDTWTDDDTNTAVKEYKTGKGLAKDSNLDDDTRQAIQTDHELGDPPPPDDSDTSTDGGDGSSGGDGGDSSGGDSGDSSDGS
jgi:hypothetical protein